MPGNAQGINKRTVYKKQAGLGTPATGTGGQILRRSSSVFQAPQDTFETNEIVTHQQGTGVGFGQKKPSGKIDGVLSAGTYKDLFASLLRGTFAAITSDTGVGITIAASGSNWTVTRTAGSWLGKAKVGHVIRLSVGTLNALNINKNLLVIAVTSSTVLLVKPLNGSPMFAEGPVTGCTVAWPGKTVFVPSTGHVVDYYTFEEQYSDITRTETYTDHQVGQAAVTINATGNPTVSFDLVGLNRVLSGADTLTTPTAATTSKVLNSSAGLVIVAGAVVGKVTTAQFTINGNATQSDATIGSQGIADEIQRGRVLVTGSFTSKFDAVTLQTIFDTLVTTNAVFTIADDLDPDAEFLTFVVPKLNLTGDTPDDGEKTILRSYPFTAQINGDGGPALASDLTIFGMQDSLA